MSKNHRDRRSAQNTKSSFQFEAFSIDEKVHPQMKAAMLEAAHAAMSEFPKTLDLVRDQLCRHDPIGIMACFAGYGLLATVDSTSGGKRRPFSDIEQHHAELLQAIILSIPPDRWGYAPVVPHVMQVVFDSLPKIFDTFFLQRMAQSDKVEDEQELVVLSIQERIRLHTMGVRNWANFSSVVKISKELYSAIDDKFVAHHGFSCTDFIDVMNSTVSELEQRQREHWNRFRRFMRGKNARQVFRLYFQNVPDLVGSAETMLAALPGIDLQGAKAAVMGHYDLRLSDCGTFTPHEIAQISGRTPEIVEKIFRAISMKSGALADTKIEFLFLGNPVWDAPAIDLGASFFLPMPQAVFSHIHRIMDRLAADAGLKKALEDVRSRYLQEKLEAALRSALPGVDIKPGAKWTIGDQQFETDVLVTIDRTIIAAEAKSIHRMMRRDPQIAARHASLKSSCLNADGQNILTAHDKAAVVTAAANPFDGLLLARMGDDYITNGQVFHRHFAMLRQNKRRH